MNYSKQDTAKAHLLTFMQNDTVVYTTVRKVDASGMSRTMNVYVVHDGFILDITYRVAQLTDNTLTKDSTLRIGGGGMDMGFHLVDELGHALGLNLKQRWL